MTRTMEIATDKLGGVLNLHDADPEILMLNAATRIKRLQVEKDRSMEDQVLTPLAVYITVFLFGILVGRAIHWFRRK